jgi:hypothetical protein
MHAGESIGFDSATPHVLENRWDVPAEGVWLVLGRNLEQLDERTVSGSKLTKVISGVAGDVAQDGERSRRRRGGARGASARDWQNGLRVSSEMLGPGDEPC